MRFRISTLAGLLTVLTLCALMSQAQAQTSAAANESGHLRLYKYAQAIGEETYRVEGDGQALVLTDTFHFTDRSTPVDLDTTFRAARDLTPLSFASKGKVARMSAMDLSVQVGEARATVRQGSDSREVPRARRFFVINGYAPIAQQMLLVRYWLTHGRPPTLDVVPQGTVHIVRSGTEHVTVEGRRVTLTRYRITGLIWGQELIWLDERQRVVAAVTTDAEFDHFEAIADGYESLLPTFIATAGRDGMAALSALSRTLRPVAGKDVAIVGGTLIDGTGHAPVPDAVVVVRGGRVAAAGPRATIPIPAGATVVNARGKTVIPGLWDMHAHFNQVEWGPLYLAAGVTTVRDVGNEFEFITSVRDAIAQGRGLGPDLQLAGQVDGTSPMSLGVQRVDSAAEARTRVANFKAAGFRQMKIYQSVTLDMVREVAAAAHAADMTVTGHVPAGLDVYQVVEAGMDQINHADALLAKAAKPLPADATLAQFVATLANADLNGDEAQRLVAFLKAHNVVVDPTLALMELIFHGASAPITAVEPGMTLVATPLATTLAAMGIPDDLAPDGRRVVNNMIALVGLLHKAGVRIVAGTDQAVPGHSLHRELELYVQAGFTPMEALQAATLVPAQVLGLDGDVGTVQVGKRADLLVLDANPLEDIHNVRSVSSVMTKGVLYRTEDLWNSIGFTPPPRRTERRPGADRR